LRLAARLRAGSFRNVFHSQKAGWELGATAATSATSKKAAILLLLHEATIE
jgi:hypothetical protein